MSDWQPIETAPKDGTQVILLIPGWRRGVHIGSFEITELFRHGKRDWRLEKWVLSGYQLGDPPEPTHWIPLPLSPEG